MTSTSSFITSIATSSLIFFALFLVFLFCSRRKGNRPVYYPAILLDRRAPSDSKSPGGVIRSPWTSMKESWNASEDELVGIAGLDAAVYVYFLKTALKIIFWTSCFCLPVLIPIAATDNNLQSQDQSSAGNSSRLDTISMGNVQNNSARLWAFLIGGYWLSFVTYYILRQAYRHVIELRARDQHQARARPEQFTCIVRDIPPPAENESREEQVHSFFQQLHPETYEKSLIVTGQGKASKVWAEMESAHGNLAKAQAMLEQSKSEEASEGVRPQNRTGKFGLYGEKVDSIDYWSEKIKELTPKLTEEQNRAATEKQKGAAIIFFNNRRAAAEAGQEHHSLFADKWQVLPAPDPRALVWDNIGVSFPQRVVREIVVYVITFFTVVFYMIPIGFVAALTTLENLTEYLPFLNAIVDIPVVGAVIEAYLPQLALILFLALLPKLLLALSKQEGLIFQGHVVRAASGKMYYFVVFNVFLGVTLFGTLFNSADSIKELTRAQTFSFNSLVNLFGERLPPNATYFITYITLKGFVGFGLELSRVVPLIMFHLKKRFRCKTEKEVQDAWAPRSFKYIPSVPNDLLVITITLAYAVIAPLILPFGLIYFGVGWFVQRNQAQRVYVPEYETGGRMWPHIHSRILVGLFVSQITMLGYFGLKKFPYVFLLLPLPFITLLFARICRKVYYPAFKYVTIAVVSEGDNEVPPLSSAVAAFTPTCLLEGANEVKFNNKYDGSLQDAESQLPSSESPGTAAAAA
ncbi:hypothetical protein R1sor_026349 [Riccia sorocarpa]|uniref:Uncharacterized protein n=1 Tax=Riccia sorocarpa TaxID=122646 RepID=A0ABD3GCL0_9MARC